MDEQGDNQPSLEILSPGTFPIVSLKPAGYIRGYLLLSYISAPFLLGLGETLPNVHSNFWGSRQIAKTFLDLGYAVDVIDWDSCEFKPQRDYSYCIDIHNLERLTPFLNKDCTKIL